MTDDRIQRICTHVEGPTVLDLGAVQHDLEKTENDDWLHAHLVERFDTVVGVDMLADEVEALRDRGYQMRRADATDMSLDVTADTVVAGELIEHVDNPGGLVASARDHLRPGGRLVITTPNPWAVVHLRRLFTGKHHVNEEHVAWFGPIVLEQLLERYGFRVEVMETTNGSHRGLTGIAHRLGSEVFGGTTWVAVAVKVSES